MKRSQLNKIIEEALEFCDQMHFRLPPFAYWTLEDWKLKGEEYQEIKDNMLGWDITDFGSGDFNKCGLLIFTLRNGNFRDPRYVKPYCEKILIQDEGQVLPSHFHWKKMEDIINRGGGNLLIQLFQSNEEGAYTDEAVEIRMDGRQYTAKSGEIVRICPGESITLMPGQYHRFWGEPGTGKILLGEVSTVNDDRVDNHFYDMSVRLPDIEEDVPPKYLIFNDY
jgi:D-lyxose ketol-isomerase